jgi:hypothetical protein
MASVYEGSHAAASATVHFVPAPESVHGLVSRLGQVNGWTIVITLLLGLVAYDQCE